MVRTQIQLDEHQYAALKARAAEEGVSLAELVRRGISCILASSAHASTEERVRRAIDAAGRFRSGLHDLAEKHDAYLDEAFES